MTLFPDTNETLIARVKDLADSASWTEFVGIYQPVILRMAKRRGMQDADALDVVQQVFVSVAKSIEAWEPINGGPPFRAWLAKIARNAITNGLSRRPTDTAAGGSSVIERLQLVPQQASLDAMRSELDRETQQQAIRWAAEQIRNEFSDDVWLSFWRTAIEGETIATVAASLNRTEGSIYVARYRVITRIKQKVQELSHSWENDGERK